MNHSILLTDDDPISLKVIEGLVQKLGYTVFTATNGSEAIAVLDKNEIHVVITDYEMEPLNGLDVLSHIIKNKLNIPLILFTSVGDFQLMTEAWAMGIFDFLTKPVDGKLLAENIRLALAFGAIDIDNHQFKATPSLPHARSAKIFEIKDQVIEKSLVQNLLIGIGVESVADIFDDFKTYTLKDILGIKIAHKEGHKKDFKALAHKVKGSCASMGLSRVQSLALSLESEGMDAPSTSIHLEDIIKEFHIGVVAIEDLIKHHQAS